MKERFFLYPETNVLWVGNPTCIAHEWCTELLSEEQLSGVNLQVYWYAK